MTFKMTVSTVALVAALCATAPSAQGLAEVTISTLSQQVEVLRTQLGASLVVIADNRQRVDEIDYIIANAPAVTEQMIADLQTLVDSFSTESAYYQSIQSAREDIGARIDRYRASPSEIQKQAAETLAIRLEEFEAIDQRRDELVGRALASMRGLSISKDDLEALIVVEAYTDLRDVFTEMLDSYEQAVVEAEGMNTQLSDAAGIEVE